MKGRTNKMADLERKFMGHYVDASMNSTPDYEQLGDGIEEMSIEMGANVQKTRDITGKTKTYIDGYEKSQAVSPYKANSDSNMFKRLQNIADENKVLDDLNTTVIDVHLWETPTNNTTFPAIRENAVIELSSYGGDTSGYQLPFTLHRTGVITKGTFDTNSKTFTATEE
jgi:hypothetical protein